MVPEMPSIFVEVVCDAGELADGVGLLPGGACVRFRARRSCHDDQRRAADDIGSIARQAAADRIFSDRDVRMARTISILSKCSPRNSPPRAARLEQRRKAIRRTARPATGCSIDARLIMKHLLHGRVRARSIPWHDDKHARHAVEVLRSTDAVWQISSWALSRCSVRSVTAASSARSPFRWRRAFQLAAGAGIRSMTIANKGPARRSRARSPEASVCSQRIQVRTE